MAVDRDYLHPGGESQLSRLLRLGVSLAQLAVTSTAVLLAACTVLTAQDRPGALERRGRALAERMCAQCHAIGTGGSSPHAGAPPFRALDRRLDLDGFVDRLREGLTVGHPDMPAFHFSRDDARAFVLYLRSIQGP